MSQERVESDYYAFMGFDRANAESVLSHYVGFFEAGPVLELGSGPGVFLDLLQAAGIACRGVDSDAGMVRQAQAAGHDVVLGDALAHLGQTPAGSLAGVFAAHFLEHLDAETAQAVYHDAARVLQPDGVFVAVVPNAACVSVLGHDFWRDPTHVRFYDPLALEFFARQAGQSVLGSGGNPRNHPGPPPGMAPHGDPAVSDLSEAVSDAVRRGLDQLQGLRWPGARRVAHAQRSTTEEIGHLLSLLNAHNLALNDQVVQLRASLSALLAELYPPNEVYVVARNVASR